MQNDCVHTLIGFLEKAFLILVKHWKPILACLSAVGSLWGFFYMRMRELRLKRTEYLFEMGKYLDSDNLSDALLILEKRHPNANISSIYGSSTALEKSGVQKYKQSMDKLLNFFERLSYAVFISKALSVKEAGCFGWYLDKIQNSKLLSKYCKESGFDDVLKLAKKVCGSPNPQE